MEEVVYEKGSIISCGHILTNKTIYLTGSTYLVLIKLFFASVLCKLKACLHLHNVRISSVKTTAVLIQHAFVIPDNISKCFTNFGNEVQKTFPYNMKKNGDYEKHGFAKKELLNTNSSSPLLSHHFPIKLCLQMLEKFQFLELATSLALSSQFFQSAIWAAVLLKPNQPVRCISAQAKN